MKDPGRAHPNLVKILAAVLHTEIVKIRSINASASYAASPGALGSALRNAGLTTAVIGNADLPGEMHREAAAVAITCGKLCCG